MKIKKLAHHIKESQTAINSCIRELDDGMPCVSCGRHHKGQWHAGH
ncbi:recombination protein NinG [Pseudomonas sp. MD330_10]